MAWPYRFLELDQAAKHSRRQALDRYGLIAHGSVLILLAASLLYRLGVLLVNKLRSRDGTSSSSSSPSYVAIPNSPGLKRRRQSASGSWTVAARKAAWWLEDDVECLGRNWGQRAEFIFGSAWTLWLLFCCVNGTGNDYMHLTKRFGTIAASQLPIQYVLALKKFSPVASIFHSSHEAINRWHRVLGRIIYFLLYLHAAFYLNYFYQVGILTRRITDLVPALGITAFIGIILLNTTALSVVREYSYRIFFITHLVVAFALPPIVFFHHRTSAFYVSEALGLFVIDLAIRKWDTFTADASIVPVPGSNLIKIAAPVPSRQVARFRERPGTHVYLSIPAVSRPNWDSVRTTPYLFEAMFNPFTVASVGDEDPSELTLIARCRDGPMTLNLARLARGNAVGGKSPLSFEGPYGHAARFPNLAAGAEFDQLLLVAGGVGASFIVPLYRAAVSENPEARVRLIWAVRDASDAAWPVTSSASAAGSVLDDDRVQLFLTGNISAGDGAGAGASSTEIEMTRTSTASSSSSREEAKRSSNFHHRRPDLQKIVDDVFRQGTEERVAVLVCGPEAMARELRRHVGVWVRKGRKVFWHNESFAW